MTEFIRSLLTTPAAVIALVSAVVALLAYLYQRNEKKKDKACIFANHYAKNILPRLRFISFILISIDATKFTDKFVSKMSRFDNAELNSILSENYATIQDIENTFCNINTKKIEAACISSGMEPCSNLCYNFAKGDGSDAFLCNNELLSLAFRKYVIDCLNELESYAICFRYNIYDEKIVYQSLHQTFLSHMKYWYFFIAQDNYINHADRYYCNLIWLYNKWNKRRIKQNNKSKRTDISYIGQSL